MNEIGIRLQCFIHSQQFVVDGGNGQIEAFQIYAC